MSRLARTIGDKRPLPIIRRFLQAGLMQDGACVTREEGTPLTRGEDARFTLSEDKDAIGLDGVARPLLPDYNSTSGAEYTDIWGYTTGLTYTNSLWGPGKLLAK